MKSKHSDLFGGMEYSRKFGSQLNDKERNLSYRQNCTFACIFQQASENQYMFEPE
jgi:hypothetical protein